MQIVNERELKLAVDGPVELDALHRDAPGEAHLLRLIFSSGGERAVVTLDGEEPSQLADMLAHALSRQRPSPQPLASVWAGRLHLEGWPEARFGKGGCELVARMETLTDTRTMSDGISFEVSAPAGYLAFVPHGEAKALLEMIRKAIRPRGRTAA